MKKIATIITGIATVMMIFVIGVMPVSAEEVVANFPMEIISGTEADINTDGKTNILDLLQAKSTGTSGEKSFVIDVLFGKEVSKTYYDLDEVTVNPNKTNALEDLFDKNDRPVKVYKIGDSDIIAEFYNKSEYQLKCFKLEKMYGADSNANKYMEFVSRCNLPITNNEICVCSLSINKLGKIGWSADSFMYNNSKVIYELDEMEASIPNIALIQSVLRGWEYEDHLCLNDGNITEVHLKNEVREVIFRTENTNIPIENWFFRTTQSYGFGIPESFIFGVTKDGFLNINYVC